MAVLVLMLGACAAAGSSGRRAEDEPVAPGKQKLAALREENARLEAELQALRSTDTSPAPEADAHPDAVAGDPAAAAASVRDGRQDPGRAVSDAGRDQKRPAPDVGTTQPLLRWKPPPPPPEGQSFWDWNYDQDTELVAQIVTNHGSMVMEFLPDVAPGHVTNFIDLASKGYYDGLTFHRVIPDYLIQGGCPRGDGMGGPGYQVKAELNDRPHLRGTVSMAHFGHPDSAGSQFFICLRALPDLDGKWTVFGQLISGLDSLDVIARLGSPAGEPSEPIVIQKVVVQPRGEDEATKER